MTALPPALTTASLHWVLPEGVVVVPENPLECPSCHTARAFFLVEQQEGGGAQYRCFECVRGPSVPRQEWERVRRELGFKFLAVVKRIYEDDVTGQAT